MRKPVDRLFMLGGGALRERQFRLLFFGRTTSFAGSAFANVALAFAVLDITRSKADLGFVLAARSLPQVVFLLFGGVWADRLPRNRVMVASDIVSGASQLTVAVLLLGGAARIWELVVLAAVNGTGSAFFYPASTGIVPQTVPRQMLQSANAFLRLGLNSSQIVGAALGGFVVAVTSPGIAIAIDSGSFFVSAAFVALMHLPATMRNEGRNVMHELMDGWRAFASRPWLWAIVVQAGFVNAAKQGSLNVLGPVVAKAYFGGAAAWGAIATALGLGFVIGGFVMMRFQPSRILLAATSGLLITFPLLIGLAVPLPLLGLITLAGLGGLGSEVFGVLWDTALQQQIPQEQLSRVASYDAVGSLALTPLGYAAIGPLAAAFSTRATLLGAATVCTLVTLAVLLVPAVRTIQRVDSLVAST
jgi:MFS family permease